MKVFEINSNATISLFNLAFEFEFLGRLLIGKLIGLKSLQRVRLNLSISLTPSTEFTYKIQ